ncbi:MAG: 2-phospho-L-lactate/phosphoenolpyruvate guanylyltransferase [Solirubrobacteraceae bacterium]|jgi:2-phospho-L-lactate guanylyltransferase|nr:2-phospho-L-lactate/phosphoenolpyruvate guanylyltransferase [Solirubrobacteraceae bacterium]
MSTIAVLPVKRFDEAKQRLGEALRGGTRRALAEAMLTDVLTALRRSKRVDGVVVVTREHGADALARAHDARTIRDPDEPGHNPAASEGVRWALEQGARRVLLVPGDCPALDPVEVDDLLLAHPHSEARVTIVPDRHGSGTNALVLCPPDAIAPSFGPGSRARHEALAREAGAECRIAEPPSLALDVDTIEDLNVLRAALDARTGGAAHTRGLLARLGRR